MSITEIYSTTSSQNSTQPFIDIVIIQSLRRLVQNRDEDQEKWWANQILQSRSSIRTILVFNYEARFKPDEFTWTSFLAHGSSLLYELSLLWSRSRPDSGRRLIFICHTLGGLVLKQALIIAQSSPPFRDLYDAVSGIIFICCPHDETHADFNTCHYRCAVVELRLSSTDSTIQKLDSPEELQLVQNVCKQFRQLRLPCPVYSFGEQRATRCTVGRRFQKTKRSILVPLPLIYLGFSVEEVKTVDLNHEEIISFAPNTILRSELRPAVSSLIDLCLSTKAGKEDAGTAAVTQPFLALQIENEQANSFSSALEVPTCSDTSSTIQYTKPHPPTTPVAFQARSSGSTKLPYHIIRPYQKNSAFFGRNEVLEEIRAALTPNENGEQASFALCGMGGMGKTQIGLAYAFESLNLFPVVLWAHSDTRAKLAQSYADFAFEMCLVDSITSDQITCRERLKRWFETADIPWLLIFDNADGEQEMNLLDDFWPAGNRGSILVTTRDKAALGQFTGGIREVQKLEEEDAVDLLIKLSRQRPGPVEREDAAKICARVDYLPLALGAAAFIIHSDSLSFAEYLSVYSNRDLIVESKPLGGPTAQYAHSLTSVWGMNFTRLDKETRFLLNIMAFLDPDKIQEDLIAEGALRCGDPHLNFLASSKNFLLYRGKLSHSILIYRNPDLKHFWMHRLVQESCHIRMDEIASQAAFDAAFHIVCSMWPVPERHNRQQPALWIVQQCYLPHIASLAQHYKRSIDTGEFDKELTSPLKATAQFAELLYNGAWYLYERGDFTSASPLLEIAKEYCFQHPENAEVNLADIHGAFASRDSESNHLESALLHFQLQWEYLQKAFDKGLLERNKTLASIAREALSLGGLGNGYAGLQQYSTAEKFYWKCLKVWKNLPSDPTIYEVHLAACLTMQGKFSAAEKVLRDCIGGRAAKYGPLDVTSYRTGVAYYALGNLQVKQGKAEAVETYQHAMDMLAATLGRQHHRYGDCVYKRGCQLLRKGFTEESRDHLLEALAIFQQSAVYSNEEARTQYKLKEVYNALDLPAEAEAALQTAEVLRKSLMKDAWTLAKSEEDFDCLITYISR